MHNLINSLVLVLGNYSMRLTRFNFAHHYIRLLRILAMTHVRVFLGHYSTIPTVTGNMRVLSSQEKSHATVINLGAMREVEAVNMLLVEANNAKTWQCNWITEEKHHALTIVRYCGCNPVAVRSI